MKRTIIAMLLIIAFLPAIAHGLKENDMPKEVINTFKSEFPNAKHIEYSKEKDNGKYIYQAEFIFNNKHLEALFDEQGKLIQTEEDIKKTEVPTEILIYLKSKYHNFKILEASKLTRNKEFYGYDIEIRYGNKTAELEFDKNNKFIREH